MAEWDNDVPAWEDFLKAAERGTVVVTKNCYIPPSLYPKDFQRDIMLFGLLTPIAGLLAGLCGIGYWLLFSGSWWWVVGGLVAAIYFISVASDGCAQTVFLGAGKDRLFYLIAVSRGAFYFPRDHSDAVLPEVEDVA